MQCVDTGLVYRNPKPHLRAMHAWHPSVVHLGEQSLLCTFDLGQAVESLDYHTCSSHSADGGRNWSAPQPLVEHRTQRRSTHSVRISRLGGDLVGFGGRFYRDDPEAGLTNRKNLGFVPMDLVSMRSTDQGKTWDPPATIVPSLAGPAFEICHPILELQDGRWLAPTQTWRGWDGEAPNGMKAIALVSHDRGSSWSQYIDILDGTDTGVLYFEQSVIQLLDGRLLAVAWAYEEEAGRSQPNPYVISEDGQTFCAPQSTGLHGETAKILCLPDSRILCLYRRIDRPGLWANLSRLDGDRWVNLGEAVVWQGARTGLSGQGNTSDRLGGLKLGYPQPINLPDGDVLAVFWCCEDNVFNIRWVRIGVDS
jgi:sialidase-1